MMKFIVSFLLLFSSLAWSNQSFEEKIFNDRKEMVKALKEFISDVEKSGSFITYDQTNHRWVLIEEAWADEAYNCFYGGWPSTLSKQKFCQQPQKFSSFYEQAPCGKDQLRCQPQLFGKNTCAPFSTLAQKKSAFYACEKKFQASKDKDYKFTESFEEPDFARLREIGDLAGQVCSASGKLGVQKNSPMCKKLLDKLKKHFPSFLHGTDIKRQPQGELEVIPPREELLPSPMPVKKKVGKELDCVNCMQGKVPNLDVDENVRDIINVTSELEDNVSQKYLRMKEKFLKSSFCDPDKMWANPPGVPNPLLLEMVSSTGLFKDAVIPFRKISNSSRLAALKPFFPEGSEDFKEIKKAFDVMVKYENPPNNQAWNEGSYLKVLVTKKLIELEKQRPELFRPVYKETLVEKKILTTDEEGNAVCPFPSEEAFRKAYDGFQKIKNRPSVLNKGQLTIVDYTMPSMARRMFVMDLKDEDVLHNTWTSHGVGDSKKIRETMGDAVADQLVEGQKKEGRDPYYEAPPLYHDGKKAGGTWLTREGFMIASGRRNSPTFGDVIGFHGLDKNNSNNPGQEWTTNRAGKKVPYLDSQMISHTVWMHSSQAPAQTYLTNSSEIVASLNDVNMDRNSPDYDYSKIALVARRIGDEGSIGYRISKTMGCLGVTTMPIKQLDKKGRNVTQFEALKQDLPGTVILAYTGPEQKSLYFK